MLSANLSDPCPTQGRRAPQKLSLPGLLAAFLISSLTIIGIAQPVLAVPLHRGGPDLLKQSPTQVTVRLGNQTNSLVFEPDQLFFVAGKRYKLVLTNPSNQKHYFTAKDFADAIWTQKIEAGNVEIKGVIHELELKPGAEADWMFVPIKSGTYPLRCTIAGHTEAGMTGTITISSG